MTMMDLNNMVIEFYEQELPKIGLLKDGKTVRDYYYHSVSHSLGLDCHDVTTPTTKTLRPGMVITVEPGLYIEEEALACASKMTSSSPKKSRSTCPPIS